jgi:DNA polymerase III, delta subunit
MYTGSQINSEQFVLQEFARASRIASMKLIVVSRLLSIQTDQSAVQQTLSENYAGYRFTLTYPEETKYKISEIKKLTAKLSRKAFRDDAEDAYVLMNADALSPICQNALLKTLEESNYTIILIVQNIDSLLPTVRSRCTTEHLGFTEEIKSGYERIAEFDDISAYVKVERDKVKSILETMMRNEPGSHSVTLVLQDAIRKLEANCKIESVLFDMVWRMKNC